MRDEKKIAIALIATKGLLPRFIRWVCQSKFNHLAIVYEDRIWTGFWALEAKHKGVIPSPFDFDDPKYKAIELHEYIGDLSVGLRKSKGIVLSGYDFFGAFFGMVYMGLRRLLGLKKRFTVQSSNRFYCFELGVVFLQYADVPYADKLEPSEMFPTELEQWLKQNKMFRVISREKFLGSE